MERIHFFNFHLIVPTYFIHSLLGSFYELIRINLSINVKRLRQDRLSLSSNKGTVAS